ncbi:hypothetical protein BO94DRAFT_591461 [Aspergillus sclerotioniger CBS 115572]|uniref:Wax synthase domain-containing protein n=1 Tax=Aspergillus sclerotioniger CBS 115572 TaxID=1450535 RepID=A0A317UU65_9EURO|nr:hypothetical protein BO94DRAFT_591461 [Aspergillus sclerotioniger CBS 115572]PWY65011.1 hypothetical protein BO94DRAFT_591461 [Aspergillus sclerotioniger CBS 115572]
MLILPFLVVALFLQVKFPLLPGLRDFLYGLILLSACSAIFYPPESGNFITYANAFLSTSLIIRAVELLLVRNLSHVKRLQKVSYLSSSPLYAWEPISPTLGLKRFLQVCDLVINPRAIGWSYGSPKYQPPLQKMDAPDGTNGCIPECQNIGLVAEGDRFSFLTGKLCRVAVAYVLIDSYQAAIGRNYAGVCEGIEAFLTGVLGIQASPATSEMLMQLCILPTFCWMISYAFVDGIHAAGGIFSVGILRVISPQIAGDPWMYPPVFGAMQYLFTFSLRDIWGKMWHDLCRRPFLALSLALIPDSCPTGLKRFLVICVSFAVSGIVHSAGTYSVSKDWFAVGVMMVFFCSLPFFLAMQQIISEQILPRTFPRNSSISRVAIWLFNATFLMVWGHYTSPWYLRYSELPEAMASIPLPFSLWRTLFKV